jgi:hypothetical protein
VADNLLYRDGNGQEISLDLVELRVFMLLLFRMGEDVSLVQRAIDNAKKMA